MKSLTSYFFFFFSSRRRHTRLQGDWSSDVCSSDLYRTRMPLMQAPARLSMTSPARAAMDSRGKGTLPSPRRSEEHTSELQSPCNLVCRLLLEKKNKQQQRCPHYRQMEQRTSRNTRN